MNRLLNDLYALSKGKDSKNNNKVISFYNFALTSMTQKNYENAISSFKKALQEDAHGRFVAMIRPNLAQLIYLITNFKKPLLSLLNLWK